MRILGDPPRTFASVSTKVAGTDITPGDRFQRQTSRGLFWSHADYHSIKSVGICVQSIQSKWRAQNKPIDQSAPRETCNCVVCGILLCVRQTVGLRLQPETEICRGWDWIGAATSWSCCDFPKPGKSCQRLSFLRRSRRESITGEWLWSGIASTSVRIITVIFGASVNANTLEADTCRTVLQWNNAVQFSVSEPLSPWGVYEPRCRALTRASWPHALDPSWSDIS